MAPALIGSALLPSHQGVVLQQHHRFFLDFKTLGTVGVLANRAAGLADLDVGVLEQAELELFLEQALGGLVDALLADQALIEQVLDRLVGRKARQGVGAAVDGRRHALGNGLVFQAPGHRVDDAGVGIDVALEAELVAQQVGDDRLREGKAGQRVSDTVVGQRNRVLVRHRVRSSARRSTA